MSVEKICGIYCISNHQYFYIGQARDIYRRWGNHRTNLKHNKHCNLIMQHVYNKYHLEDPFQFTIVRECSIDELDSLEKDYIVQYFYKYPDKKCMNIAEPGKRYKSRSEFSKTYTATKKLIQDIKENPEIPQESTNKSVYQFDIHGRFIAEYESPKQASDKTGIAYPHIINCLNNKAKTAGKSIWSYQQELNPKKLDIKPNRENCRKPVYQYSIDGEFIKEWNSRQEAATALNITSEQIRASIRNKTKQAGGFIWKNKR